MTSFEGPEESSDSGGHIPDAEVAIRIRGRVKMFAGCGCEKQTGPGVDYFPSEELTLVRSLKFSIQPINEDSMVVVSVRRRVWPQHHNVQLSQ